MGNGCCLGTDFDQRLLGEEPCLRLWRHQTEKRRPQQHTGDHLADHLRLAEVAADDSDDFAGGEDDGELEEQFQDKIEV